LDEAPEDMAGTTVTPTANDLFTMCKDAKWLDKKQAETFHHLTAKMLYLSKRAHPDILPTVSFLITWVADKTKCRWLEEACLEDA
jgi:hypothetical protein